MIFQTHIKMHCMFFKLYLRLLRSDTPNAPKTPALSGGWDAETPYNQPTPAAYPNAPSVPAGVPATPFVAPEDTEAEVPSSGSEWATTDIEVKIVQSGARKFREGAFDGVHGVIREKSARQMVVKLGNGETQSIPVEFLEPVRPEKRNSVKFIGGDYKDGIGTLISMDGEDGVVKLQNGSEFKVVPMKFLGKYVP